MRLVNRSKSEFTASVNVEIPSDETDSKGLSIRLFLLDSYAADKIHDSCSSERDVFE